MAKTQSKKRAKHLLGRHKNPAVQARKAEMQQMLLLYKPFPFGWKKAFLEEKAQYNSKGFEQLVQNTVNLVNSNLVLCKEICDFIHRFKEQKLINEIEKARQLNNTVERLKKAKNLKPL